MKVGGHQGMMAKNSSPIKMQSQQFCMNLSDIFIPTCLSVCQDHMVYNTTDWYMTRRIVRQSSYKVSGTVHSVGDHTLIIYIYFICQSNAVITEGPWLHPWKLYRVDL